MIFTSIIEALGWDGVNESHWVVRGSWYISILLSLFSVVLGAQQTVLNDTRTRDDLYIPWRKLCPAVESDRKDHQRPNWALVLAWQGPLMFLSYSLVMFMVGLTAYIITPVARKQKWDDDAKVWTRLEALLAC